MNHEITIERMRQRPVKMGNCPHCRFPFVWKPDRGTPWYLRLAFWWATRKVPEQHGHPEWDFETGAPKRAGRG